MLPSNDVLMRKHFIFIKICTVHPQIYTTYTQYATAKYLIKGELIKCNLLTFTLRVCVCVYFTVDSTLLSNDTPKKKPSVCTKLLYTILGMGILYSVWIVFF